MKKYLLLAAIITIILAGPAPPAGAADGDCRDVEIVWLRGSGQPLSGPDYDAFARALNAKFRLEQSSPSYGITELAYPAVTVNPTTYAGLINSFGAFISSGQDFAYGASAEAGITQLTRFYKDRLADCPDTHFVLAGYSQGAHVIADVLPQLDPTRVSYAALFGEPRLSLPEGIGVFPAACRGNALSSYRIWAPNCYTHAGALGARAPYIPPTYAGRVGLWCNSRDIICGSSKTFADMSLSADGHAEYRTNGQMNVAANKIYDSLKRDLPPAAFNPIDPIESLQFIPPLQPAMDTVLVIDSTGSMHKYIDALRAPALEFVRESAALGGRTAIVEYRDKEDEPDFPRVLCDFSCTPNQVEAKLAAITPDLTPGNDPPEGLLLALMTAYNSLKWRTGATKNAIVLTDNTYHDPDRTLSGIVALPKVVLRSKQIDPVNTFIFVTDNMATNQKLINLATQTDGALFPLDFSVDITDVATAAFHNIASRPVALLPLDHYYVKPGTAITFDASLSYGVTAPIVKYEWDFDSDGVYDHESSDSIATYDTGTRPHDIKLTTVRVTDANGLKATMSVPVDITNFPPDQQEPSTNPPPSSPPEPSETSPQNAPDESLVSAALPKPPLAPSTGSAAATPAARRNLLLTIFAAIILILWISKQFWSQGARATSVVTLQSSY